MDCEKCAAYRESLPPEHRVYWPCGYCPTGASLGVRCGSMLRDTVVGWVGLKFQDLCFRHLRVWGLEGCPGQGVRERKWIFNASVVHLPVTYCLNTERWGCWIHKLGRACRREKDKRQASAAPKDTILTPQSLKPEPML